MVCRAGRVWSAGHHSQLPLSKRGMCWAPGAMTPPPGHPQLDHLLPSPGTSSFPLVTPTLGMLPPPSALSSISLLSSSSSLPPLYTSSIRHETTMAVSSASTASTWSSPLVTSTVTPPQFSLVVGGPLHAHLQHQRALFSPRHQNRSHRG